jgi:hypothetical protein
MPRTIWSGSDPSSVTVFQWRLFRVVARRDRVVGLPQLLGQRGIAFQAHLQRPRLEPGDRVDLAGDLVHRRLWAEWVLFARAGECQTGLA